MKNKLTDSRVFSFRKNEDFENTFINLLNFLWRTDCFLISYDFRSLNNFKALSSRLNELYFENNTSVTNDFIEKVRLHFIVTDGLFWIMSNNIVDGLNLFEKIYSKKMNKYLKPFEVTNKEFIDYLFKNNFSDNLLEVLIDDNDYDNFDEFTIFGEGLNFSFDYQRILNIPTVKIRYIKVQPFEKNSVVTIRYRNIIQFSNFNDIDNINNVTDAISNIYTFYLQKDGDN